MFGALCYLEVAAMYLRDVANGEITKRTKNEGEKKGESKKSENKRNNPAGRKGEEVASVFHGSRQRHLLTVRQYRRFVPFSRTK